MDTTTVRRVRAWRRRLTLSLTVALTVGTGALLGTPQPVGASSFPGYPGGKYLWEYAVTSVTAQPVATNHDNWARVGWYDITDSTNVTEYYWFWRQSDPVGHTVARTDACPGACNLFAPTGYQNGPASKHGTWTYSAATGMFAITYDDHEVEVWKLNTALGKSDLARMDLTSASYTFGHGWTYGSNPSSAYGPSASWVLTHAPGPYSYGYGCWSDNPNDNYPDKCASGPFNISGWTSCPNTGECISGVVSCGTNCGTGKDKHLLGTFSGQAPRKAVHEFYAIPGTAGDYCPDVNQSEHVQALREIVGDTGTVYGFIGVEASLYGTSGRTLNRVGAWHWTDISTDPRN